MTIYNNMSFNKTLTTLYLAHHCLMLIPMYSLVQVLTLLTNQKMCLILVLPCIENCSLDVHINIRCKKCTDLSGWILRTFISRDSTTLMTDSRS